MTTRVLALDDEEGILELLGEIFIETGFSYRALKSSSEFRSILHEFRPDILILDQMMPEKQGDEIIEEIRRSDEFGNLPVLMLSGRSGEEDKVAALNKGADDYLTKPFSSKELVARVNALVRRADISNLREVAGGNLSHGDLIINLRNGSAEIRDERLPLTTTEFRFLVELLTHKDKILSREHLIREAMGGEHVTHRTVDVHMAGLRKKMGEYSKFITTARGVGYRFSSALGILLSLIPAI